MVTPPEPYTPPPCWQPPRWVTALVVGFLLLPLVLALSIWLWPQTVGRFLFSSD